MRAELISQVEYCSYFMLIHGLLLFAEEEKKEKKSFLSPALFMLVSDSEAIEALLFMYL